MPPADGNSRVVVSYREIGGALTERVMAEAAGRLEEVEGTSVQRAAFLTDFAQALRAIEIEESRLDPGVLAVPRNRTASLLLSLLAEEPPEGSSREALRSGGSELKFSNSDIWGWFRSLFTWIGRIRPHHIIRPPRAEPTRLPEKARVGLLGDWGTGLYGAVPCAQSIKRDREPFDLLMHLGDVYYSGTNDEVQDRFLDLWPHREGAINRAINSNHEMYSGGHAYFDGTLPAFAQDASYFALQNENWLLVGLDVAHTDHDLDDEQVKWLEQVIEAADGRKVALFSHHQLFSRFDGQGPKLAKKLGGLLASGRIFAWYWGHEHRCILYEPDPRYGGLLGRCLGHGGMPYTRRDVEDIQVNRRVGDSIWRRFGAKNMVPGGIVLDGPNPHIDGKEDKYGPNGYMTLEFEDRRLTEVVHTAAGEEVHRRQVG
ncbi:MAG: metallophosphoesterase family protein [Rubrobacteraceae bacterium]